MRFSWLLDRLFLPETRGCLCYAVCLLPLGAIATLGESVHQTIEISRKFLATQQQQTVTISFLLHANMPSKRRVVPASSDRGEAKRSKVIILKTASAAIDLLVAFVGVELRV